LVLLLDRLPHLRGAGEPLSGPRGPTGSKGSCHRTKAVRLQGSDSIPQALLPLKRFRGRNWATRWQRLRRAQDGLAILPPIEVVKHGDRYWVVDGHNRVGLALYSGQPEIDATITELVAPGERRTEPIVDLAPTVGGSQSLRTAASGHRASEVLAHEDRVIPGTEEQIEDGTDPEPGDEPEEPAP